MRDETQRAAGMPVAPEVAALLTAAQRVGDTGPVAEKRALDAFRAARDEGAHAPVSALRRRRRDDWRPVERWRGVRSIRAVVAGLVAVVALGGVAMAAGSGTMPGPFGEGGHDRPDPAPPANGGPAKPGGSHGSTPTPRADRTQQGPKATGRASSHPDQAQDDTALCRAYRHVQDSGKAADATAFDRLASAAGGASAVPDYCDGLLVAQPSKGNGTGKKEKPEATPAAPEAAKGTGKNTGGNSDAR
ncbi:hypothetical protein [Streptomyces sp. NRRL S-1824]|uniref:hypothetical protein n=1 Tax=Streptomyces sp. NRRL S-1824 TaxID=1463889 RepID=UPI00131E63FB|nr:hypothetical protein [Streptomyces sp. NRRL S-1824]